MSNAISKLRVTVKNIQTHQPLYGANVYWNKIPCTVRKKSTFCNKYKHSETGLTIDVTNQGGFSLLLGKLFYNSKLWFYIHKIVCPGYKESRIEKHVSVKGGAERELTVFLMSNDG